MVNILFFLVGGLIFSICTYVVGVLVMMGFFREIHIPILDDYVEWKEKRETNKYNQELLEAHKLYFKEEPVVKWK